MTLLHILLLPFSICYGLLMAGRNRIYDSGIFKSTSFDTVVISVGNLSVGGVGKTPHVEYLIRLLQQNYNLATLSRGYKRNTTGFHMASAQSTVQEIGDEPLQYHLKFPNISVAVDEKRVHGILQLEKQLPNVAVVLLDDAFQHRAVKPMINILVSDASRLYIDDFVLPAGRLREFRSGSQRADIIVISKTSPTLSLEKRKHITQQLDPKTDQLVFFSYIQYRPLVPFTRAAEQKTTTINADSIILLLTGIANSNPILEHLKTAHKTVEHLEFPDHHNYTATDIVFLTKKFSEMPGDNKVIISTEKDIMRLSLPSILDQLQDLPIFYVPIEICFHGEGKQEFDRYILEHVTANSRN